MSKKLFIGLAPLLAIAAFVVIPAVAQGACLEVGKCHFFKNGTQETEGVKIPTVSWGTVTLTSADGVVTCENAVLGNVENPTGGGSGVGETNNFATANCVSAGCEPVSALELVVTAENLPWGVLLKEGEKSGGAFVIRNVTKPERTFPVAPGSLTGELTSGSKVVKGISSTAALKVGDVVLGTPGPGVPVTKVSDPAAPSILKIISATEVELYAAATATETATFTIIRSVTRNSGPLSLIGAKVTVHCVFRPGVAAQSAGRAFEEAALAADPPANGDPDQINVPVNKLGEPVARVTCSGEQSPEGKNGTGIGSKPSSVIFDAFGTGALSCEDQLVGPIGAGTTSGSLKTMGYAGQEIIATK